MPTLSPNLIDITDYTAELQHILSQIEVLCADVLTNYFDRAPHYPKRSAFIRAHDFKVARLKTDLLHQQVNAALERTYQLKKLVKTMN